MTTVTISMPESLKAFIETQVAQGGFGTVSEYFRCLIRDDRKRKDQEKLESMLLEGIRSESSEMTQKDWEDIRHELRNKIETRAQTKD